MSLSLPHMKSVAPHCVYSHASFECFWSVSTELSCYSQSGMWEHKKRRCYFLNVKREVMCNSSIKATISSMWNNKILPYALVHYPYLILNRSDETLFCQGETCSSLWAENKISGSLRCIVVVFSYIRIGLLYLNKHQRAPLTKQFPMLVIG